MLSHDLQTLRIFLTACELRSMSKASERLHIALSAASRRVGLLEHEAGTQLIVRRPHGIEPTAAGVTMMNYARDVLRLGEKLQVSLEEHRLGVRGYVRVCASSSVLVHRLAHDLSRFVTANPEIKLDLEERPSESTIDAVLHKQADIGVIVRSTDVDGLTVTPYEGDQLAVAMRGDHPLAGQRAVAFADILDEDLVALESGTAVHRLLSFRARELGRVMKTRVQVRSFEVMCLMIGEGLGIGILPEKAVQPLAQAMGLRLVRLAEPWAKREYAICVLSSEEPAAPARRLIDFLTGGGSAPARKKPRHPGG
ncbi:MAG: LysR family transcriptional regulator [Rhodoplanes sp.]|uniref:LysR family transcriptional regulator n=1 Tax=Rhodoplanes sp. TaxID=1968906 RepID=UPI0018087EB1|nr:LysR family transcriptional regulator [Rhodoplanes sp.]NVO15224.1 LysR family transcriptional regulator [Rhodoplanes sp.]